MILDVNMKDKEQLKRKHEKKIKMRRKMIKKNRAKTLVNEWKNTKKKRRKQ